MKGDLILIGSEKPHVMDYIQLEEALIRPDVSEDLSRVGMQTPAKLFRKFLIGGAELSNYTAGARLNTDDRPIIEFNAPRNLYAATSHTNQVSIVQHLGGAELAVPVVKMAEATSDGLTATALELVVRTTPVLAEGDWQASWLVERQLMPAKKEGASRVVAASRAMLTWQEEGATENQVSAFHLPVRPKAEEQQALLRWLAGRPIRGGKITMPGGRKGTWLMASGKQTGLHVLAITWGRPSESGFYIQYVAMRTQQNPIKGVWESTLLGLAKRFRPIGVAKK